MITPEQFIATQKAHVETLLGLGYKAFEAGEKIVELNLQTARSSLTDASETTLALLSVKDPQELLALHSNLIKPAGDKFAAYQRELYGITSEAGAEFGKAVKVALEDAQKGLLDAVDEAGKNGPAGTESVVALFKSALTGAAGAYDGLQKSARQMGDVAAANFTALSDSAVKATQSAAEPKRVA